MKRYTGQKALYEAISRSRAKTKPRSILERLLPEPAKAEEPVGQDSPPVQPAPAPAAPTPEPPKKVVSQKPVDPPTVEKPATRLAKPRLRTESKPVVRPPEPPVEKAPVPVERAEPVVRSRPIEEIGHTAPPSPVQPWLRPRPVQLNEGRIEVSVPYYVGIIVGLAVLVIVLASYRLGQARGNRGAEVAGGQVEPAASRSEPPTNPSAGPTARSATDDTGRPPSSPAMPVAPRQGTPVPSQGDNWFVLATYDRQQDLDNVKEHFAKHGIALEVFPLPALRQYFVEQGLKPGVLPPGDGYMLVTLASFDNPNTPGSDGYKMKQKIADVGALYKGQAPTGSESFAPNYFRDAYPMKIR